MFSSSFCQICTGSIFKEKAIRLVINWKKMLNVKECTDGPRGTKEEDDFMYCEVDQVTVKIKYNREYLEEM